jgi:hypothetical protein
VTSRRRRLTARRVACAGALVAVLGAGDARAWLTEGHRRVTADAVRRLPDTVPAFLRDHPAEVADAAGEPDYWRSRDTPALADAVSPEHYLDAELLRGAALPDKRSEYVRMLARKRISPSEVGTLPYAIVEGWERLVLCFARVRLRPGSAELEARCRAEAGHLAHYIEDLEQPLHTTVDHDGRADRNGKSPRSGIHKLVDGLFSSARFDAAQAAAAAHPARIDDVWTSIRAQFAASHALVERVYGLEPKLRSSDGGVSDPSVVAFTTDRYRATVEWLASLVWSAWERSSAIDVPDWIEAKKPR